MANPEIVNGYSITPDYGLVFSGYDPLGTKRWWVIDYGKKVISAHRTKAEAKSAARDLPLGEMFGLRAYSYWGGPTKARSDALVRRDNEQYARRRRRRQGTL